MKSMKTLFILAVIIIISGSFSSSSAQNPDDRITINDSGTQILPVSKALTIRQLRSMKVNVVTGTGNQITYSASITANKLGMERHFGDGKLKYSVADQVGILEYKPFPQPEEREQSWLKTLFTKETRYEAKVDRATLTITVPDDILLTVDSRYSDVSVIGLKRALTIVGRYGKVLVQDHLGDLRIDNHYGSVTLDRIQGEVSVDSRSTDVKVTDLGSRFTLRGQSINLEGTNITGFVDIQNRSGKSRLIQLKDGIRIEANYGDIHLTGIAGEASINSKNPTRVTLERIGSLRSDIDRGEIRMNDIGSSGDVTVNGDNNRVTGTDIKGSVYMEGSRNTIDLTRGTKNAIIRNSNGTVNFTDYKGGLNISGSNNIINLNAHQGTMVEIDQTRGTITMNMMVNPTRLSVVNSNGDIVLNVPSSFAGKYSFRNQDGLLAHNLGSPAFSEQLTLPREITGGNAASANEIRIVNRNGNVTVKK